MKIEMGRHDTPSGSEDEEKGAPQERLEADIKDVKLV